LGLAQVRQGELAGGEHADQVEIQQGAELLHREVVDRPVGRAPARVVDQAVEAPVAFYRGLDQAPNLLDLRDVARYEPGLAALLATLGLEGRAGLPVAGAEDDLGAGRHEDPDAAFADALGAAGDDRDLVRVTHVAGVNHRPPTPIPSPRRGRGSPDTATLLTP